ncbi:MAG: histidine kinase [Ferruginibacter sp.]|nr:histidine kinase [Ferruginibacter sp.]
MTSKDWWLYFFPMYPVLVLFNYWLFGAAYFKNTIQFFQTTFIAIGVGTVLWFVLMHIMLWVRRKYPSFRQTATRIMVSFALYSVITAIFTLTIMQLYAYWHFYNFQFTTDIFIRVMVICICSNFINGGSYEFIYTFEKWKQEIHEKEELQKLQFQKELHALKSQVNPHFLFNSLNSLSSLIGDEPEKAEKFLDEMSKVYRYLLRNNEVELTNLATELQFIRSYFHLLKTRYGEGVHLNINVSQQHEQYLIPPLTLQLLVENAVKHNMLLKESPLQIEVLSVNEKAIIVRNNLQKKINKVESNKVGLRNIAAKYRLMNQPGIVVEEKEGLFSVIIPLIENER